MKLRSAILVPVIALQAISRVPAAEPAPATPPPAPVATAPVAEASPKIVFAEREFVFGRIMSGVPVQHDFVFTNTGNSPLLITSVVPGCHCTTAGAYSNNVAVGQTGVIPILFDGSGNGGTTIKQVTVQCNDRTQPVVSLVLKGFVVEPVEVSTTFVGFNLPPDSTTNASTVVHIHNNTDSPVTLEEPQSNQPSIAAELKTLQPGKDFEMTIHTVLSRLTNNAFAMISIKTSQPGKPPLTVSVNASILPPLSLMPAQVIIPPAGQVPGTNAYRITVQNNSIQPLALSDPEVNIWGAKVVIEETAPGKTFALNVTVPPGFEIPAGTNYSMSFKTSNPRSPSIRVPIIQIARALPPGVQRPPVPPVPAQSATPPAPSAANNVPR